MRFTTVMALLAVANMDIASGNMDNGMESFADPSENELLEEHIEDEMDRKFIEEFPEDNEEAELEEEQLVKSTPQEDEDIEEDSEVEYETDEENI